MHYTPGQVISRLNLLNGGCELLERCQLGMFLLLLDSLDDDFPLLIFTFEGGANMTIPPHDYFLRVQRAKVRRISTIYPQHIINHITLQRTPKYEP